VNARSLGSRRTAWSTPTNGSTVGWSRTPGRDGTGIRGSRAALSRAPVRRLLAEARERGDIPSATDLELAVDLLAGPAFYRRFIAHRAFPHDYATAVVDHVLTAIGHATADKHEDPA
jgi:hypothetical protein